MGYILVIRQVLSHEALYSLSVLSPTYIWVDTPERRDLLLMLSV